ncbi:MAG: hypothetical protein LCH83_13760 [Proteobacteria bacterium]|nr:hypothetical protein [Pseudomonadota bacterium]
MSTESDRPFIVNNKKSQIIAPQQYAQSHERNPHYQTLNFAPKPNPFFGWIGSLFKSAATLGFGLFLAFGVEKYAPQEYKISEIVGTYEANVEGIVLERTKGIETYYLTELESYKGEVNAYVEASNAAARSRNDAVLQHYKASYDRNQILTQSYLNLRSFSVQKFVNIAETLNSTDLGVSSGSLAVGRLFGKVDPALGQAFMNYGTEGGELAARRLEEYFKRGMAIELPDANDFLPTLEDVQNELDGIKTPDAPRPPRLVRYSAVMNKGE